MKEPSLRLVTPPSPLARRCLAIVAFPEHLGTDQTALDGVAALLLREALVPQKRVLVKVAPELAVKSGIVARFEAAPASELTTRAEAGARLTTLPGGLRALSWTVATLGGIGGAALPSEFSRTL